MEKTHNYHMHLHTPASWYGDLWKEALPAGNGKIGVSVYGGIKKETILVNHCNLWHWGKRSEVPNVADAFIRTRELIQNGNYREANSLTAEALLDAGYESELYKPCPVGDIRIEMNEETAFTGYERSLDMESGEIAVAWNSGRISCERDVFVSRVRDIIVVGFKSSSPEIGMDVFMQLHETFGEDTKRMRQETEVSCFQSGETLVYKVQNEENGCFGMVCKVLSGDGTVSVKEDRFCIRNTSDMTIAFKVYGAMDAVKTEADALNCLEGIPKTYEQLLKEHAAKHSELFHSAGLSLGSKEDDGKSNEEMLLETYRGELSNSFCEMLWNYGRYLFLSGTRPDTQPFQIYGLWSGRYDLIWSHNMANINIQMMYWHCVTGGYVEYLRTLIDYYCSLMPDLRENARQVFGLDGIFLPAGTTPGYGVMNQVVPVIVNWIGGAGWIAQHMYEYYLATGDEKTLREKILPFMEEAAQFYEQYVVRGGDCWQVIPSVSPENTPGNLQDSHLIHMAHANPTAKNATMDVAILRELFTNLIEVSEEKGLNEKKIPVWRDIAEHLPEYQINADGAVKEWLDDQLEDFYYHRHFSHLYPVFPGREMMLSEDEALLEAFKKAVELRIQGGQSGWSLVFRACLFARLSDGDQALECLDTLAKGCLTNTFLSLHNDWRHMGLTLDLDEFGAGQDRAPVQLDASIGIVNVIQEMILQYAPGMLRLLPALPSKWDQGRVTDFGFLGGTVDMEWDIGKGMFAAVIKCSREQNLKIRVPKEFHGLPMRMKTGQDIYDITGKEIIEIKVKSGEKIEMRH